MLEKLAERLVIIALWKEGFKTNQLFTILHLKVIMFMFLLCSVEFFCSHY